MMLTRAEARSSGSVWFTIFGPIVTVIFKVLFAKPASGEAHLNPAAPLNTVMEALMYKAVEILDNS